MKTKETTSVFQIALSEHAAFADMLRHLITEFGPADSRYSPERLFVIIEPGDKHEDGTNEN